MLWNKLFGKKPSTEKAAGKDERELVPSAASPSAASAAPAPTVSPAPQPAISQVIKPAASSVTPIKVSYNISLGQPSRLTQPVVPTPATPSSDSPQVLMERAVQRHQGGDLPGALRAYDDILAATPDFPPALNMKGVCLSQMGQVPQALECLRKAVTLKPDYVAGLCNLGNVQMDADDLGGAIDSFSKASTLSPQTAAIQTNLGLALLKTGQMAEAVTALEKALELDPSNPQVKNNLGNAYQKLKRLPEAAEIYRDVWQSHQIVEAAINWVSVLRDLGQLNQAQTIAEDATRINPSSTMAWEALATVLEDKGQIRSALEVVEQGLKVNPRATNLLQSQVSLLLANRQYDDVIKVCDRAVASNVVSPQMLADKAAALHEQGQTSSAVSLFEQALQLDPTLAKIWISYGDFLAKLQRRDEAATCFKKAFALAPHHPFLMGQMLMNATYLCDWTDLDALVPQLESRALNGEAVAEPFSLLALTDNPEVHAAASTSWAKHFFKAPEKVLNLKITPKDRISIGYFSADFHNHATAYLMAELFERHDRSRFEIIGLSFGRHAQDAMRDRLVNAFDKFIDVSTMSDAEIAALSRELKVDIAVDLKGYTAESRPQIFAHEAAPIQVNYLGYPGTMGTSFIDYILVDEVICPPDLRHHYQEKVVTLPNSYQVNDSKRAISTQRVTRAEAGLPEHGFVFCCFNNNYKITSETFDSWMRILKQVDQSVLWLFEDNPVAVKNLAAEAARRGIDPNRLVFAKRAKLDEHLARHRLADLFLDTLPYNAHTTTSDALWTGLPVITLLGKSFPARVAASLLHAVGLPELVTHNRADYERLAIDLAKDGARLSRIRSQLSDAAQLPLFDIQAFTNDIEAAYELMYERARSGLPPDHISIRPPQ